MNQEEKIYQKIKNASNKTEETSFPGMDKVWNRVEEKLDQKKTKKAVFLWKKLAIAASFLLFFTVGVQLYTTQKELTQPIEPLINTKESFEPVQENSVITFDDEKAESTESLNEVESFVNSNSNNAKKVISESKSVAVQDDVPVIVSKDKMIYPNTKTSFAAEEVSADVQFVSQKEAIEKGYLNSASSKSNDFLSNRKIYAARSSNMKYENLKAKNAEVEEITTQAKNEDLVVVDGKLSKKKKEDLNSNEFDEMVELKNPTYIINGEEFSEESLFGEKPTSKYAPLNSQKIDSIKVYLPEEAIPIYGSKGKNGIVIISIKK
jgi:hypothetical protein